jgi:hypothetical protein
MLTFDMNVRDLTSQKEALNRGQSWRGCMRVEWRAHIVLRPRQATRDFSARSNGV